MSLCGCTPSFCGPTALGCFGSCDKIYTGMVAPETGMYRVVYTLNGVQTVWQFAGVKGHELCFDHKFREYGVACFKIVTPSLCYLADEEGNCSFTAQIFPSFESTEAPEAIPLEEKEIPAISCPFPEVPVWMLEENSAPAPPKEEKLVLEKKSYKKKEHLPFERKKTTRTTKERLVLEPKTKKSNKKDRRLPLEK